MTYRTLIAGNRFSSEFRKNRMYTVRRGFLYGLMNVQKLLR